MDSVKGLLAAAIASGVLGFASPAAAADPGERAAVDAERSEQHFKKGTRAFEDQKYSEAYASLRTAYDLAPTYRTAAGLGQVELHLGQYRDAAEHLSFCLRHFPADGDPAVKGHVEQGLEQAREHVAALRVRVNVENADVSVDGKAAGKSPLEGLLFVEPGSHVVTASRDGKQARRTLDAHVRATEDVELTVPLDPAPGAAPPAATGATGAVDAGVVSSSGLPPSTWALIVGGSLTAVALGTSIAFYVKGAAADDDATAIASTLPEGPSGCRGASSGDCIALGEKLEERNDANRIGLIAAIGTGVFAAGTAATFLVLRSSERSRGAAVARPWSLGFRTAAGTGGTLTLQGGF